MILLLEYASQHAPKPGAFQRTLQNMSLHKKFAVFSSDELSLREIHFALPASGCKRFLVSSMCRKALTQIQGHPSYSLITSAVPLHRAQASPTKHSLPHIRKQILTSPVTAPRRPSPNLTTGFSSSNRSLHRYRRRHSGAVPAAKILVRRNLGSYLNAPATSKAGSRRRTATPCEIVSVRSNRWGFQRLGFG